MAQGPHASSVDGHGNQKMGSHGNRIGGRGNRIGGHGNRIGGHGNRIGGHGNRIGGHGWFGLWVGHNTLTEVNEIMHNVFIIVIGLGMRDEGWREI